MCFSMVRTLAADIVRLRSFARTAEGPGEP